MDFLRPEFVYGPVGIVIDWTECKKKNKKTKKTLTKLAKLKNEQTQNSDMHWVKITEKGKKDNKDKLFLVNSIKCNVEKVK